MSHGDDSQATTTAAEQGRAARHASQPYSANPYSLNDAWNPCMEWAAGWRAADQEIIKQRVRAFNRTYERNAARRGQYEE